MRYVGNIGSNIIYLLPEFYNSIHSLTSSNCSISANTGVGNIRQYTCISYLVKTPEMLTETIDAMILSRFKKHGWRFENSEVHCVHISWFCLKKQTNTHMNHLDLHVNA